MMLFPAIVEEYMDKVNANASAPTTNSSTTTAHADAEHVIIAMGSVCDTIEETIDYLNANGGKDRFGQSPPVPSVLGEAL